jgi:hypothetical protein
MNWTKMFEASTTAAIARTAGNSERMDGFPFYKVAEELGPGGGTGCV